MKKHVWTYLRIYKKIKRRIAFKLYFKCKNNLFLKKILMYNIKYKFRRRLDMKKLSQYKLMTMKTLIGAAKSIMDEEGLDSITIRKVGERAKLNSATIYNYFENLEHLKIFACLFVFDEYSEDIKNYIDENNDSIDNYIKIWECFIKHTVRNTEVFYTVFFNELERTVSEYIYEYHELFPVQEDNYNASILRMISESSVEKRNIALLEKVASDGFIKNEDIIWINDMSVYTYESLLFRMHKLELDKKEGERKMTEYINRIIQKNRIQ